MSEDIGVILKGNPEITVIEFGHQYAVTFTEQQALLALRLLKRKTFILTDMDKRDLPRLLTSKCSVEIPHQDVVWLIITAVGQERDKQFELRFISASYKMDHAKILYCFKRVIARTKAWRKLS
ncbi:MAG: hypothetical protein A2788_02565 [Candidatus Abawacabacteria bacterium RIFCSPHIGHO2_01_FULL_46_8]|uniref:Uncharacterized protein n=1 Tax=Candidatus Abawacabacteria bacterium RIFCSPHIGHO2_01_FULL_46_8 TaxID=1817815 RepID=A0A1F4XM77_9BACT|nr:MAG: hypothetical protein A2788_02565 [Candidatus Abawacabacteria bacterium RIFCSPHIGHO2_01_FULL_46_8]